MLRELVKSLAENKVREETQLLSSVVHGLWRLMTPTYFIYNIFKTVIGNDSNVENEGCIVKLKQENKNNFYHIFFRLFYVHEHHRDFFLQEVLQKNIKKGYLHQKLPAIHIHVFYICLPKDLPKNGSNRRNNFHREEHMI